MLRKILCQISAISSSLDDPKNVRHMLLKELSVLPLSPNHTHFSIFAINNQTLKESTSNFSLEKETIVFRQCYLTCSVFKTHRFICKALN